MMNAFVRKSLHKLVFGHSFAFFVMAGSAVFFLTIQGPALVSLLASATSSLSSAPAVVFLTPYETTKLAPGEIADIDVNINARVPVNAVGATIAFPEDIFEVVGINEKKSFLDLWTEDTTIKEGAGELHFSGGTTQRGGLVGTGTVLTLSVRAKKIGEAKVYVKDLQVFAHDGKGTPLDSSIRSITYEVVLPEGNPFVPTGAGILLQPNLPSPDFNNSGYITLVDFSMLSFQILSPYNPRFDLNADGTVGLTDLSILFTRMTTQ